MSDTESEGTFIDQATPAQPEERRITRKQALGEMVGYGFAATQAPKLIARAFLGKSRQTNTARLEVPSSGTNTKEADSEKPKTPAEKAVYATVQDYRKLLKEPIISASLNPAAVAVTLSGALVFDPSIKDDLKGYRFFHDQARVYPEGITISDSQFATLGAIADISRTKTQEDILAEFNEIFQTLAKQDYFLQFSDFNDQTDLAVNATAMLQIPGVTMKEMKEIIFHLNQLVNHTGWDEASALQQAPGLILITRIIEQMKTGDRSLEAAVRLNDSFCDTMAHPPDTTEVATLALAAEFLDGSKDERVETVKKIFERFNNENFLNLTQEQSAALALASVLGGTNEHKQIEDMFLFARTLNNISDDLATQLTLATAMKTSPIPLFIQKTETPHLVRIPHPAPSNDNEDENEYGTDFPPYFYTLIQSGDMDYFGSNSDFDTDDPSSSSSDPESDPAHPIVDPDFAEPRIKHARRINR